MKKRYLSAKETTELLGISVSTLYAYVSRGLIRSEAVEGDTRQHRYHAEDVRKLKARQEQRKDPTKAAQDAMHWGTPILESALTLITDDNLYYRGYSALELAVHYHIEDVASLLWQGDFGLADAIRKTAIPVMDNAESTCEDLPLILRLIMVLTQASAHDLQAYTLSPDAVMRTGTRILKLMAATLARTQYSDISIAELVCTGWCSDLSAVQLIDAALILCADHELNASSFAARIVASAEAQPYAVVLGGLAALQGFQHGGNLYRVEALLREIRHTESIRSAIRERVQRGERIPGFGHRLYPDGDPRAKLLLELIGHDHADSPAFQRSVELSTVVDAMLGIKPNIDFALATLQEVLGLPTGAALALFGLGRTVGWIGHAIEQYERHSLIRPRATYTGLPPRDLER